MTDYYPLLKRAVDGLEKSSGEARRTLYERARSAHQCRCQQTEQDSL